MNELMQLGERPERPSWAALSDYGRRWDKKLFYVSLAYLVVVLYEMLPGYRMTPWLWAIDAVFCAIFAVDYGWRVFVLAPDRKAYARTGLCVLDAIVIASFVVTVLLAFLLPLLNIFFSTAFVGGIARLLRVIAQMLRFGRAGVQAVRTVGEAQRAFTRRSLGAIAVLAVAGVPQLIAPLAHV